MINPRKLASGLDSLSSSSLLSNSLSAPAFTISMLGSFHMFTSTGGDPVVISTVQPAGSKLANQLCAYLVLHQQKPVKRAELAVKFWPNSTHAAALENLRHCLVKLRKALGSEAWRLRSDDNRLVSFDLTGAVLDTFAFELLISSKNIHDVIQGIHAYTGPLLKDFSGGWIEEERGRLEGLFFGGIEALTAHSENSVPPASVISTLERAYDANRLNEPMARCLMIAYESAGRFDAATKIYLILRKQLRTDFDFAPTAETATIFARIREVAKSEQRESKRSVKPDTNVRSFDSTSAAGNVGHIPLPQTHLIGREDTFAEVISKLEVSQLVTLWGPGGIGKTQLSIAIARSVRNEYRGGVWFVDLGNLSVVDANRVPNEILSVLCGLSNNGSYGSEGAGESIVKEIGNREVLLILDNCEHLIGPCSKVVKLILSKCKRVRILTASRCALRVQCEVVVRVPSLSLPRSRFETSDRLRGSALATAITTAVSHSGISLFVDRAKQARQMFEVTHENISGIVQICRLLDGIPLAIELAAPWVRSLSIDQLKSRIENHIGLLKKREVSANDRHKTLEATVEWSYNLLSETEKRLWRQVSRFVGGFTLEAAEGLMAEPQEQKDGNSEAVLNSLTTLIDAAVLIYYEAEGLGRYRFPETLRLFARARAANIESRQGPTSEEGTFDNRFLAYFAHLGEAAEPELLGENQAIWLVRVHADRGSLAVAFELAARTENCKHGLRLAASFWRYFYVKANYESGYAAIAEILSCCKPACGEEETEIGAQVSADTAKLQDATIRSRAETGAGNLAFHAGKNVAAREHFEEAYKLQGDPDDISGKAKFWGSLGLVCLAEGNLALAKSHFETCNELFEKINDIRGLSAVHGNLAIVACNMGDYATACQNHQASILLFRETGDLARLSMALANLAAVYITMLDEVSPLPLLEEALEICRILENPMVYSHCLYMLVGLLLRYGMLELAALVSGAHTEIRREFLLPLQDDAQAELKAAEQELSTRLGHERFGNLTGVGAVILNEGLTHRLLTAIDLLINREDPALEQSYSLSGLHNL